MNNDDRPMGCPSGAEWDRPLFREGRRFTDDDGIAMVKRIAALERELADAKEEVEAMTSKARAYHGALGIAIEERDSARASLAELRKVAEAIEDAITSVQDWNDTYVGECLAAFAAWKERNK